MSYLNEIYGHIFYHVPLISVLDYTIER